MIDGVRNGDDSEICSLCFKTVLLHPQDRVDGMSIVSGKLVAFRRIILDSHPKPPL